MFDVLIYLFGNIEEYKVIEYSPKTIKGTLILKNANVEWLLSVDRKLLKNNKNSDRYIVINDKIFDFTTGFEDLHTKSYFEILKGNGFTLSDARAALELTYNLRKTVKYDS